MIQGIFIAFAMYSRIWVPHTEWNEKNMRYAMGFFPLVGVVIGAVFFGSFCLLEKMGAGAIFRAAVLTAVPIALTGGIHADGYLDVIDARHSYGDREKKLRILKDPHIGAFAVIYGILYYLVLFGIYSELDGRTALIISAGFICSRGLSGLAAVTFLPAKREGMLCQATKDAKSGAVRIMTAGWAAIGAGLALWKSPVCALASISAGLLVFWYYHRMSDREFGGITGDLAGYFLMLFELWWAAGAIIANAYVV